MTLFNSDTVMADGRHDTAMVVAGETRPERNDPAKMAAIRAGEDLFRRLRASPLAG